MFLFFILFFRKHTVALGGLWCLCAAYYKIEPYELEMPAFPHIPRKRDHGFSSTLSLQIHCRKTNVHLHASFFSLNLSRTGGMASDSSSPFWKAFLLSPSAFEHPRSSSTSVSPESQEDIPLSRRLSLSRGQQSSDHGSQSLESRVQLTAGGTLAVADGASPAVPAVPGTAVFEPAQPSSSLSLPQQPLSSAATNDSPRPWWHQHLLSPSAFLPGPAATPAVALAPPEPSSAPISETRLVVALPPSAPEPASAVQSSAVEASEPLLFRFSALATPVASTISASPPSASLAPSPSPLVPPTAVSPALEASRAVGLMAAELARGA